MADGKFPLSIGLSGLVAYSAVMVLLSLSFVWSSYFRKSSTKLGTLAANVRFVFRLYVYMFLIGKCSPKVYKAGRISWFVLHTWVGNNDLTFTLNRLSIVTFLTAFTLILFYWFTLGINLFVGLSDFIKIISTRVASYPNLDGYLSFLTFFFTFSKWYLVMALD